MIIIEKLFFRYESKSVLEDISFKIEKGDFIGLLGPNGSGKTTLLKIIDGVMKPTSGMVLLDGMDLKKIKREDISKKIAVVPQNGFTNFQFKSLDIVLMGRSPYIGKRQFETKKDIEIAENAMRETDCLHCADKFFDKLSGGEKQRILIARAIAQEPEILLLDEPNVHLDINHQIDCFELLKKLNRRKNVTVIAVSHDLNLISEYSKTVILMNSGKIFKIGNPDEVLTSENIESVYGCRVLIDKNPETNSIRITLLPRMYDNNKM
jgi:iron complex transport system ATP-binding protein